MQTERYKKKKQNTKIDILFSFQYRIFEKTLNIISKYFSM